MSKKDLPLPSGDGKIKDMDDETILVTWTVDWGAFDAPPESDYSDEDIHYGVNTTNTGQQPLDGLYPLDLFNRRL